MVPLAIIILPIWAFALHDPAVTSQSVSCGSVNRGRLAAAAELQAEGTGFVIPEPWLSRRLRYGTTELVGMIRRAALAVEQDHPGSLLGVADLSRRLGGPAAHHRSHQSGRDVDLVYYAIDSAGRPIAPGGCMPAYQPDRWARRCYHPQARDVSPRRFDVARNWALIRAMLTDPQTRVRVIFMSLGIRRWLLEHAKRIGEPPVLIRRAEGRLLRPPGGRAHTDHMHVRVACTLDDRRRGRCRTDPDRSRRRRRRIRRKSETGDEPVRINDR